MPPSPLTPEEKKQLIVLRTRLASNQPIEPADLKVATDLLARAIENPEDGAEPEKPQNVQFGMRMDTALHDRIAELASKMGLSKSSVVEYLLFTKIVEEESAQSGFTSSYFEKKAEIERDLDDHSTLLPLKRVGAETEWVTVEGPPNAVFRDPITIQLQSDSLGGSIYKIFSLRAEIDRLPHESQHLVRVSTAALGGGAELLPLSGPMLLNNFVFSGGPLFLPLRASPYLVAPNAFYATVLVSTPCRFRLLIEGVPIRSMAGVDYQSRLVRAKKRFESFEASEIHRKSLLNKAGLPFDQFP